MTTLLVGFVFLEMFTSSRMENVQCYASSSQALCFLDLLYQLLRLRDTLSTSTTPLLSSYNHSKSPSTSESSPASESILGPLSNSPLNNSESSSSCHNPRYSGGNISPSSPSECFVGMAEHHYPDRSRQPPLRLCLFCLPCLTTFVLGYHAANHEAYEPHILFRQLSIRSGVSLRWRSSRIFVILKLRRLFLKLGRLFPSHTVLHVWVVLLGNTDKMILVRVERLDW